MDMHEDPSPDPKLQEYVGGELELFRNATNWKAYWHSQLRPYISGDVLEVGAGIGSNVLLIRETAQTYTGVEPDPELCKQLDLASEFDNNCTAHAGTIDSLDSKARYDTILYIDVLEHIEEDAQELQKARDKLKPNGRILVLCPAYQFLYSPFDQSVGHFRRYNQRSLSNITPDGVAIERTLYLDAAGCLASMANKYILRSDLPSRKQVLFWDRVIVPVSKIIDPLIGYRFGKTVIQVLCRKGE